MPHAELKYSADLTLNAPALLAEVEAIIAAHDSGAGACKGRAYPTDLFHHTHAILSVSVLPKPHRDAAWCRALLADLEEALRQALSQPCAISLELTFSGEHYVTYPAQS